MSMLNRDFFLSFGKTRLSVIGAGILSLMAAVVLGIACARLMFPADLYIWSESPLLTNMLKIKNGVPLYQDPSLANSFVYPPGINYLHYALLSPFGLQLSIVANRALIVLWSVLAALLMALAVRDVPAKHESRSGLLISFCFFLIGIHAAFTADVFHPDNLHVLALALTFFLTVTAIRRAHFGLALAAVIVGALSLYAKQPAALLSPCAALCIVVSGVFSRRRNIVLFVLSGLMPAAALGSFFLSRFAMFYTHWIVLSHTFNWYRFPLLLRTLIFTPGWFLITCAAVMGFWMALKANRSWALTWLLFLLLGCVPCFLGDIQAMGVENNLTTFHVFLIAGTHPLFLDTVLRRRSWIALAAMILAAVLIMPLKQVPDADMYRYANQFQDAVSASVARGEKLLVAHGTAALIKAGQQGAPLDRANSVLELDAAGMQARAATQERIAEKTYDRIMLNNSWYGPEIEAAIEANYKQVAVIPAAGGPEQYDKGIQGILYLVRIFVPK